MSSKAAKREIVSVGGGKRMSLAEVAKVAANGSEIELDAPSLQKMDEAMTAILRNKPEVFDAASAAASEGQVAYPVELCRGGLFYRIVSMMHGRSGVRGEVALFLANMLNAGIVPCFSGDNSAGAELVAAFYGQGSCYFRGEKTTVGEALKATGLVAPTLFVPEANSLAQSKFLTSGSMFVVASALNSVNSMLDCVSALSCEIIGFAPETFDSVHYEMNRQHRGQIASANNLRLLLEGSKRKQSTSRSCIQVIPQINGTVSENINALSRCLDIELNSAESGPSADNKSVSFEPIPAKISARAVLYSMLALIESSRERIFDIDSKSNFILDVAAAASEEDAIAAYNSCNLLLDVLRNELFSSVRSLNALDEPAAAAPQEAAEPAESAAKNKAPEVDDSKLTPEQLAKVEAKRKAKAEKAAAKAAAKEARKGGLVLGVGSSEIRAFINKACGVSQETPLSLDGLKGLVNVFDFTEEGFSSFCSALLQKLNYGGKRRPKIPKGTKDYTPSQMRVREQAFNAIRRVFKRHGGVEIDTPVFELKEILMGKYGEDSKLIYDLADQGGELLSLRYDLTVPFARFLAMNSVGNIKRYHIAKVYRRDQPQLNRGRYREFYQCDFDIAGSYSTMVPDAEVITVAVEILTDLPIGKFMIKLNHRRLLDAIFEICGVPAEKFRTICSAVDKLDKMSWEDVKKEMVEEKDLDPAVADKIGTFVLFNGRPKELWEKLWGENLFGEHSGAKAAMEELKTLFSYLDAMGSLDYISFDLSLARGLDYYTGVIYEAVMLDGANQVGSIAAGGRYDNLVGIFSTSGTQTPCVGVSIGIERVFTIMEKRVEELKLSQAPIIDVFVASIGADMMPERMKIANLLWKANISAEYSHLDNPKLKKQLDDVLERGIPFMVVFGKDEITKGVVKLKNMAQHTEIEVPIQNLVSELLAQGCSVIPSGSSLAFIESMKKAESA